ncbi:hypothetical protein O0I10_004366 [Lichtheimia ornata]|uniref:HSF-type DNA-binding domain-containing protein n=1 Tax=Lichtheimia ornata TaxID=688661 RepID=A0AAD7V720_9FUNG|nr:uncharacterized protein O0I10_004366 [Lichtheimia ornata]KAJ8659773.1 hypothetical protein O0I10_004366 [Lichtheimia ornata]
MNIQIPPSQNTMALPDNDFYSTNMSFSSSPRSSQFSPTASSPATPYFSSSPQDGYFMGYAPPSSNDMYPPQLQPQQQPQRGHQTERKNVSTFISKLYSMVGDKKHQDLICWNNAGSSFLITNSKAFSRQVLPVYFKHGNFSSFVRQLNMYGFRKINKAPRIKRGVTSQEEIWEFSHQKFQRDWPDMLWEIKRKAVESDVLRRETGDMQACFSMVQQSQDNLLEQFRMLQDNFSTMLRGFEDLKKSQLQIQMGIQRLSQFDNHRYDSKTFDEPVTLNSDPLINHHHQRPQQQPAPNAIYVKGENTQSQHHGYDNPSVFVTSPSNLYQPYPQQQQQQFCIPQENYFLDAVNTPLPPSPLSSTPSFASENFS